MDLSRLTIAVLALFIVASGAVADPAPTISPEDPTIPGMPPTDTGGGYAAQPPPPPPPPPPSFPINRHGASSGLGGAPFALFMVLYVGMFVFMALAWVFSVLALWDCAKRDFADPNSRAGWCILIMLVHGIGALIYYIVIYRADDPPYQPRPWADARTRQSVLDGATAPRRRDAEEGTGNSDDAGADTEYE